MRKKLEQENLEKRLRERDNPPKSMRKRMENKKIDKQGKEKTNEWDKPKIILSQTKP